MAFFIYACASGFILMRYKPSALATTTTLMPVWLGVSFGLLYLFP